MSHVFFDGTQLRKDIATLFEAAGLNKAGAADVADALVEADEEGVFSHGTMLVPMYVERLQKGSLSKGSKGKVVQDNGAIAIIDAENVFGQLTSQQAVELSVSKSKEFGLGAVAVRNGFHLGRAGRWAGQIADQGCVGIVLSNTRPLMPAPGGAERIIGNNPLAIAMPGSDPKVVLDMAMSASAMGKIRMAEKLGNNIPEGWAVDSDGRPTTDPSEAIKGMLLPAAGPKGFGLALMIDLLCGALSSGGVASEVRPLFGDLDKPYNCAHFFLAINVSHFRDEDTFKGVIDSLSSDIRNSKPAPGTERMMTPGEPDWLIRQDNAGQVKVAETILEQLKQTASGLGLGTLFNR
ncbi:Ldh family oxidoreductase [Porticoccaceae bacterium]|nr:Ldh family oxidoreductase [Porticoccaceae bacterium]|tara:strand:+ start:21750 stop:22799 length:1050 start_codon:yes stop_codon:yes gene_type:complete